MRILFLCICAMLCCCSHNSIRIGKPIVETLHGLEKKDLFYSDVLRLLGPPWRMYPYQEGFIFVYASYDSDEKKFSLSYGQYGLRGKADYAFGAYFEDLTVLYFSPEGKLDKYGTKREKIKQGWGGSLGPVIIGSDLFSNPFYQKYDYYNHRHVPFLSSLFERVNIRTGPPHRQYINEVETTPQVDRGLGQSAKKRNLPNTGEKNAIPLRLSSEFSELSKFRWFEIKEEGEKRPILSSPHTPRKVDD
ncbi:hypothetical protein [Candidatus Uabimicrobium amorphum]|uniref:Uncharacterized protein n=1 Tax=Uabimicrobium amorphum TaxID=2596890 RepID=A0A5S9IPE0_UABAM|nr:hypothetical protein [Candidatus Uabimicrobium amorphum]BBM85247.1 hypothetical protein UABAM_03610 [Candidatus Uabimicrobium amorphum]